MKPIEYNYHDSIIDKVTLTESTFVLYIDPNSLFYPSKPKIKLSFDIKSDLNIVKNWTNRLLGEFDDGENYLGAKINSIEIQKPKTNTSFFMCNVKCDYMETLIFRSLSFIEIEIGREIFVDEQLLTICNRILEIGFDLTAWSSHWSKKKNYEIFHTGNYEGCYAQEEEIFSLSHISKDRREYIFYLTLEEVIKIKKGKLKSIWGIEPNYCHT